MRNILIALAAVCMMSSCGTPTSFVSTWRDPEAQPLAFKKILVVAFLPDEGQRRSAEDRMVANITRVEAIPSYNILSREDMKDKEASRAKVGELGIDGVITMRFLGKDEKLEYVPGTSYYGPSYYQPFWGYYGYAQPMMYDPGYYTQSKVIRLETNIYDFKSGKLVWTVTAKRRTPRR